MVWFGRGKGEKKHYILWVVHTELNLEDKKHLESVIRAMKKAQETGIPILYEVSLNRRVEGAAFLHFAEMNGIKKNSVAPIFEAGNTKTTVKNFLRTVKRKKINEFEVIFAGYFADMCILKRAKLLKEKGFEPYLIAGTQYAEWPISEVIEFFGKDHIITIGEMGELTNE